MKDNGYCSLCGAVEGDCCPGDIGLHTYHTGLNKYTGLDKLESFCLACVNGMYGAWEDHLEEFGGEALQDFEDWFKLAHPDRVIVFDLVDKNDLDWLTEHAAYLGVTVEELLRDILVDWARGILGLESS